MGKIRIEFEVDWDDYDDCSTDIIVSDMFEDETRQRYFGFWNNIY